MRASLTGEEREMSSQAKRYNVAVVGATGVVGAEFLKLAAERAFPLKSVKLLATKRSAGKRIPFSEAEITVEETTPEALNGADFVFISASDEASREYARIARCCLRLQEARAHLFDRIVATREDDAHTAIVRRERNKVAERVARGLLK